MLGAVFLAALLGMAGKAAVVAGHGPKPGRPIAVAGIVDQSPGPVERRRAQVTGLPGDDVAGGVSDAAADAFDAGVGVVAF